MITVSFFSNFGINFMPYNSTRQPGEPKRVSNVPVQFQDIFPEDVVRFVNSKAASLNSSIGYLVLALLATTAFLYARNGYTVEALTHVQPLKLYTIFVGYPGTGKSSAL